MLAGSNADAELTNEGLGGDCRPPRLVRLGHALEVMQDVVDVVATLKSTTCSRVEGVMTFDFSLRVVTG